MRLIDADALKGKIFTSSSKAMNAQAKTACNNLIDRAPTIDTVKQGIWLKDTKNFGGSIVTAWHCSICGAVHEKPSTTDHYCYFCGAKMDGERSEE